MRILLFLSALLLTADTTVSVTAADLTKMDQTIRKEPSYQGKPRYCLLVFGPETKTRVWLVVDGDVLYVDRNGNGDLTEPNEKASWTGNKCIAGDLTCVPGKDGHTELRLRKHGSVIEVSLWYDDKRYSVGHQEADPFEFADRASEAPVAHIGGPQSIKLSYYWPEARQPLGLFVWVGTPGLGKGPFAARCLEAVKPPVFAVADCAFPAEDGGMPPIVTKATIKECCCCFVEGTVRVPGKAGKGLAKVTVHIPDWKESVLAPASFAVPLDSHRLDNPSQPIQTAKPWQEKQP